MHDAQSSMVVILGYHWLNQHAAHHLAILRVGVVQLNFVGVSTKKFNVDAGRENVDAKVQPYTGCEGVPSAYVGIVEGVHIEEGLTVKLRLWRSADAAWLASLFPGKVRPAQLVETGRFNEQNFDSPVMVFTVLDCPNKMS